MLFTRKYIPSKILSMEKNLLRPSSRNKLTKNNCLICCFYNPDKNNIQTHMENANRRMALYLSTYENCTIMSYFKLP